MQKHSTAQHSTAQHSTAQHSTARQVSTVCDGLFLQLYALKHLQEQQHQTPMSLRGACVEACTNTAVGLTCNISHFQHKPPPLVLVAGTGWELWSLPAPVNFCVMSVLLVEWGAEGVAATIVRQPCSVTSAADIQAQTDRRSDGIYLLLPSQAHVSPRRLLPSWSALCAAMRYI
jgi:hypothetical protein